MSAFHGRAGSVTWGTLTALDTNVHSWSIDYTADAEEITAFGVATPWPRSYIPGLTSWSGSYECRADSTNYPRNSDIGYQNVLTLYTGNIYYEGSAFITSWGPSVAVDGVAAVTVNFQGTAALSISDA